MVGPGTGKGGRALGPGRVDTPGITSQRSGTLGPNGRRKMSAEKIARLFIIRIAHGPHAGRYVGGHFGGYASNPEVLSNPPVNVPGSDKYGLWVQEAPAIHFNEVVVYDAAAELTRLGCEVEVIQVQ